MDLIKPEPNQQCPLCNRFNNRPIGVDTVIIKDDKVMLIKRARDPDAGKYAVPGGYLDRDENVEDGAKREVMEETGYEIEIIKLIGIRSDPSRFRQIVEIGFIGKIIGGEEKINHDEIETIEWFDFGKLPNNFSMDHGEIVKSGIKTYQDNI